MGSYKYRPYPRWSHGHRIGNPRPHVHLVAVVLVSRGQWEEHPVGPDGYYLDYPTYYAEGDPPAQVLAVFDGGVTLGNPNHSDLWVNGSMVTIEKEVTPTTWLCRCVADPGPVGSPAWLSNTPYGWKPPAGYYIMTRQHARPDSKDPFVTT